MGRGSVSAMESILIVVSEVVRICRVERLLGVVAVIRMAVSVRIGLELEICILSEEVPVEGSFVLITFVAVLVISSTFHALFVKTIIVFVHHGCLWLEVRSIVPAVLVNLLMVDCQAREYVTSYQSSTDRPPSEGNASCSRWLHIDEVVVESRISWDYWNTALIPLSSATHHDA